MEHLKQATRNVMAWPKVKREDAGLSESTETSCSTDNGPLTASQRVDRLFDINEFPAYEEIVRVVEDAEFDTLNFPEIIAKRHGQ